MNRYCKKCGIDQPHIKAGFASGKQLYQCHSCGKRHIELSRKKERQATTRVAFRLSKEVLAKLDNLPGQNRTVKFLLAVDIAAKINGGLEKTECTNLL